MHHPHELLAGHRSHGVFPTREAAKGFAILKDRVVGVEIHWDDEVEGATGYRSDGTGEWRVRPIPTDR
jgi:hypothetical protein